MAETRFWLIRHAIVAENERARLYGIRDVQLCPDSLVAQVTTYQALASRLPRPAVWGCTPLSRTRRTAEAIFGAGYPAQTLFVEAGLLEQNLGQFQGVERQAVPALLTLPAHPFWPLAATEAPPEGESFAEVLVRVGRTLEAKFQWQHAKDLKPEAEELPKIEAKIANGLPDDASSAAASADKKKEDGKGG